MRIGSVASSYTITSAILIASVMSVSMMQTVMAPVLPVIQRELDTSQRTAAWVMTSYLLSIAVFTPILGRAGEVVGNRRAFLFSLLGLAAGTIIAALATTIGLMILGRGIQGIGGAVLPLAVGIIRDEFPPEKISNAIGNTAATLALGGGVGLVVAGPVVATVGYQWLLWGPLVVVVVTILATVQFLPSLPPAQASRLSPLSAALLACWLVAFLLGLKQSADWGWRSPITLACFAAAVTLGVAWYVVDSRLAVPLVHLDTLRSRAVWSANLVALLSGSAIFGAFSILPAFLQTPTGYSYGFGASVTESGIFLLPLTVGMFFLGAFCGKLVRRFGFRSVLTSASAAATIAYTMLAFAHDQRWQIYVAASLSGIAIGLIYAGISMLIVAAVPPGRVAMATSITMNVRIIGGAIGSAVAANVVTAAIYPSGIPLETGYTNGFALLAVLAGAAALSALLIRNPTARELSPA